MDDRLALEQALVSFAALAREKPELVSELRESAAEFFGTGVLPDPAGEESERLAARRHLEWFLLERFSAAVDGVPAERLMAEWTERAEGAEADVAEELLGSMAGIFEVTGVEPGQGVWVRDLLGLGEYPLREPEASGELLEGDLLVGRLFPVGDALYRISPAAGCFRDASLRQALHDDMRQLRAGRRGTLRISQRELERMFYGAGAPAPDPEAARRAALDVLVKGGVARAEAEGMLRALLAAPLRRDAVVAAADDPLGQLLAQLAFDTDVDLEAARSTLLAAWTAAHAAGAGAEPERAGASGSAPVRTAKGDVRAALESFDRGRAEGVDLEQLFSQLERDLGLDGESDDDPGDVPDFPGVVGAMVDEFLWEREREEGAEVAARHAPLRLFARYGREIGVFENLGARDLVGFAALWSLEEGALRTGEEARRLLSALAAFCRWSESVQEVPLWTAFREACAGLERSLPRIVELNGRLLRGRPEDAPAGGQIFEVLDAEHGLVRRGEGEPFVAGDVAELGGTLQDGDLLRGERGAGSELTVFRAYPPEARALLLVG